MHHEALNRLTPDELEGVKEIIERTKSQIYINTVDLAFLFEVYWRHFDFHREQKTTCRGCVAYVTSRFRAWVNPV